VHTLEYILPERLDALWPQLKPMVDGFIARAAAGDYSTEYVYRNLKWQRAFGFVERRDGVPVFLVVFDVHRHDAYKSADVAVIVGEDLKGVSKRVWPIVVQWMQDNGIAHVEGLVNDAMLRICRRLFGFYKTHNHIRFDTGVTP